MKLKLALLDKMSKDQALFCLLRGIASIYIKLTLWPHENANQGALPTLSCLFCFFLSSETGFAVSPRHWKTRRSYSID